MRFNFLRTFACGLALTAAACSGDDNADTANPAEQGDQGNNPDGKADGTDGANLCAAEGGTYDNVRLTRAEATLILDLINRSSAEVLDSTMGADLARDTVAQIVSARDAGTLCSLEAVAAIPELGPSSMERLRRFSAVWERAQIERNRPTTEEMERLVETAATADGVHFTQGEVEVVLELVNNASFSQLDAIPYFRSDVARDLIEHRRKYGRFGSLETLAAVAGVGSAHMGYLAGAVADWRRFGRVAEAKCGELAALNEINTFATETCAEITVEGEAFAVEGEGTESTATVEEVVFTASEANLVLDLVNKADAAVLDRVLDRRAVETLVELREEGAICDLGSLAEARWMGPAGLKALRRMTVTWEAHTGGADLMDLMAPAEVGTELDAMSQFEADMVLQMANYATEEQLDTIPGFRADAAQALAQARTYDKAYTHVSELTAINGMGPGHVGLLLGNLHAWRQFTREIQTRPACSDFISAPVVETPVEAILSEDDARRVLDGLDNICPDTFCGGDLDYWMTELKCNGRGDCDLSYRTAWYYDEEGFPADVLEGRDAASLTASADGEWAYTGRVTSADVDEGQTWIYVTCTLKGRYNSREDLVEDGGWDGYNDNIYDHLLECLSGMESIIYDFDVVPYEGVCAGDIYDTLDRCALDAEYAGSEDPIGDCTSEARGRELITEVCGTRWAPESCERGVDTLVDELLPDCESRLREVF